MIGGLNFSPRSRYKNFSYYQHHSVVKAFVKGTKHIVNNFGNNKSHSLNVFLFIFVIDGQQFRASTFNFDNKCTVRHALFN